MAAISPPAACRGVRAVPLTSPEEVNGSAGTLRLIHRAIPLRPTRRAWSGTAALDVARP
jgi:hypothetical protein